MLYGYPLTDLYTTSKGDYLDAPDAKNRHRLLGRVQEIFESVDTNTRIPEPWDKIGRVTLAGSPHDLFFDHDIFELRMKIPFDTGFQFQEVAKMYINCMGQKRNVGMRQKLANYEPEMYKQCLRRQRRMVEVCAMIAYNDFVKHKDNAWLVALDKLKPLNFRLHNDAQRVSEIEKKLWALYDRIEPVKEPLDHAEQERLIKDTVKKATDKAAETLAERVSVMMDPKWSTRLPLETERPRLPPPAIAPRGLSRELGPLYLPVSAATPTVARIFGQIPVPENKGWAVGIALALTFAFLAQGLSD